MNLEQLKKKLLPQLVAFEVDEFTLFIHRPSINDIPKCDNTVNTLIHCVKDENGMPIFSDKDEEGRINANSMDSTMMQKIHAAILKLFEETDKVDEVEKK